MSLLHKFIWKNDEGKPHTQQQSNLGNGFRTVGHLSSYSKLIILLMFFMIGILWLYVYQNTKNDYNRTIEEASKDTMNMAIAFEEHVENIIESADKDLRNLKKQYEQNSLSSPIVAEYIENMGDDPGRNQIAICNEQGILVRSFVANHVGANVFDRAYFQVHRDSTNETLYIGKSIKTRLTQQNTIPLSRRINKPDGSFDGIVYIGIKENYFLDFYKKIDFGPGKGMLLTRADGANLVRQWGDITELGYDMEGSSLWKNIQAGRPSGSYVSKGITDGIIRVVSYRVMENYPLIISISQSSQVVLTAFEERKRGNIQGALLISLLIIGFCILIIDRIEKQRINNDYMEKIISLRTKEVEEQREELRSQNEELQVTAEELAIVNDKLIVANVTAQQERDKLAAVINGISDEVWFADSEKKLTLTNPVALEQFQLNSSEINIEELVNDLEVLRPDGSLRPIEEVPPLRALQGEVIKNQQEVVRIPSTGEFRYREVSSNPVCDGSGNIIGAVSIVRDITERKAIEDELKKHRDNLQLLVEEQVRKVQEIGIEMTAIMESINDPFYVLDKEWHLRYINVKAAQSNVVLNETHIGQVIWEIYPDLIGGELYQKYHEACVANTHMYILFKNPINEKVFDVNLYPYVNGLFVYFYDVTEKKKYKDKIAYLEQLSVMGNMAASIAHEINQPLNALQFTADATLYWYRQNQPPSQESIIESLEFISSQASKIDSIIKSVRSVIRYGTLAQERSPVDINQVITETLQTLQNQVDDLKIKVELNLLTDLPQAYGVSTQIEEIIMNVVKNAVQALKANSEGNRLITLDTYFLNGIILDVIDNGPGVPENIADNIFDAFYTTRDHEGGMGMGLALSRRIAELFHGSLNLIPSKGGATFRLKLISYKEMEHHYENFTC